MKKYLIGIVFVLLLVPSIVSAAWWNPFSWRIFNKKEVPVAIIQVPDPVPESMAVQPVVEKKESPHVVAIQPVQPPAVVQPAPFKNPRICNGILVDNVCPTGTAFNCTGGHSAFCEDITEDDAPTHVTADSENTQANTFGIDAAACKQSQRETNDAKDAMQSINNDLQDLIEKDTDFPDDPYTNQSGGTVSGAQQSSQVYQRRTSDAAVERSLAESALARQYQVAQNNFAMSLKETLWTCFREAPSAICKDGTPSDSENRSGTCSYHGGVSLWL